MIAGNCGSWAVTPPSLLLRVKFASAVFSAELRFIVSIDDWWLLSIFSIIFRSSPVGPSAIRWTRLSCRTFRNNAVRLQLHALAYNLGNFMRTLALPDAVEQWSLTTLREKLVKIGAKIVRHGRYVIFQMAEVAVPRMLFAEILRLIAELRPPPDPAPT